MVGIGLTALFLRTIKMIIAAGLRTIVSGIAGLGNGATVVGRGACLFTAGPRRGPPAHTIR